MLFLLFCPDSQCLAPGIAGLAEDSDWRKVRSRIPALLSDCQAISLQHCRLRFIGIIHLLFKSARLLLRDIVIYVCLCKYMF